jgi:hypothetical protein
VKWLRLAGGLWLFAGVCCTLLLVVLVAERLDDLGALVRQPYPAVLVLAGAIAGLLTGARLLTRPGPSAVRASTAVGVVWLVAFGSLVFFAIRDATETGPIISSSLITTVGVAAAVIAAMTKGRPAPSAPSS